MKDYVIGKVDIHHTEQYSTYTTLAPEILAMYEDRFCVRGYRTVPLEGTTEHPRPVIMEFPSLEKAQTFEHSPKKYAEARKLRANAATAAFITVEGV